MLIVPQTLSSEPRKENYVQYFNLGATVEARNSIKGNADLQCRQGRQFIK